MSETHDSIAFQCDALPNSKTHLRLLKVIQGAFDKHVVCELTTWPVDETPTYNAISYTQGDLNLTSKITINGKEREIRQNCRYVLQQTYAFSSNAYCWCDAICVDQSNSLEKGHQVAMFGSLYTKATQVLVCVGEHENDSEFLFEVLRRKSNILEDIVNHGKAFGGYTDAYLPPQFQRNHFEDEVLKSRITTFLTQIAARIKSHKRQLTSEEQSAVVPNDHGTWSSDPAVVGRLLWLRCALNRGRLDQEGVRHATLALMKGVGFQERERIMRAFLSILQRPYFTRLWVIQELHLGRQKVLCCGEDSHAFDTLLGLHQLVKVWQWDLIAPGIASHVMKWINKRHKFAIAAIALASELHKVDYQLGCLRLGVLEHRPVYLPNLLDALVHFQCAGARDRIFGSLALGTWADWIPLEHDIAPDYTIATFDLAKDILNILMWHMGAVLYIYNLPDFLGRATNLRQLLKYTPEQPSMQNAIAARNEPSEREQSVIMARLLENGWFGIPILEYGIKREYRGLYCKKGRFWDSSPQWVELIDCYNHFLGYAPPETRVGDWFLMQGLSYGADSRPPGIIMRRCEDGLHMLLGFTYPIRYTPPIDPNLSKYAQHMANLKEGRRSNGNLRIPDGMKWYAMRWSAEDLLLLEWRYMLLKQYGDDPSHETSRETVEDWCAQRICISSRSRYAIGPYDDLEDNVINLPETPGVTYASAFHYERRFFESCFRVSTKEET